MPSQPILEIQNVSKRFGATQALDSVSLDLYPGEVHALLGENGAGKSTLIKIMTGIYQADTGEVRLNGRPVALTSSADAQAHGIAAIYQEPLIFPDLTVAENIFVSHRTRAAVVNWGKMYRDAEAVLSEIGVRLNVRQRARGLTLAAQQTVEIAKAISLNVRILIMDEPTASLSAHESANLFQLINTLRQKGVAILYISHRMEEVFELADRITVFRDGKRISTAPRADVTRETAIRDMVGRNVEDLFVKTQIPRGSQILSVRNLTRQDAFSDVSFDLHRGEVLGFAGLIGARRTDVGLALFGIAPADSGEILLNGKPVFIRSPRQAIRLGIAYVTEDRRKLGLTLTGSIATNITLPTLRKYASRWGLVRHKPEVETAEQFRKQLSIRTPSVDLEAGKLSGGNQQKVVLSKWLNAEPSLLILDEPTRGIDVGAKAEVHQIINSLAAQGLAIILISSDLPEVLAMSDRILVMREGKQMGIFSKSEATSERVMTAAMGRQTTTQATV